MIGAILATFCAGLLLMVSVTTAGAASSQRDKDKALLTAAERNDVATARQLLKEGAGVRARE